MVFLKTFNGKHIHEKGCEYIKTNQLEINATPQYYLMSDGELEGKSPVTVKVIPRQIKLVI